MKNENNILVIDPIIDDSEKITYAKSDIDNNIRIKISFRDFKKLFDENPDDIFKYDSRDFISLIYGNGNDVSLCDLSNYKCKHPDDKPVLLKMTLTDLHEWVNKDIYFSCTDDHHVSPELLPWQIMYDDVNMKKINYDSSPKPRYNGYSNCQIIKERIALDDIPAVKYCLEQKIQIGNDLYQGYLPGIEEMRNLFKTYYKVFNHIFNYLEIKPLPVTYSVDISLTRLPHEIKSTFWSSTEFKGNCIVNTMSESLDYDDFIENNSYKGSINYAYTLPFFKKIK